MTLPRERLTSRKDLWRVTNCPLAAPLAMRGRLGVDLATIQGAATHVEPYLQVDGTKVWSLMQLERQLRPDVYGRVRGGYIARL